MAISYAGQPLGLLTDDYRAFLEHWHSLTDFSESDLWGYQAHDIDHLTLPSVPLPQMPEVGTLVWPTGLSRCAYAHYIVDSDNLALIRTALGANSAGPANLVLSDGTGNTRTFSLYFLCARPLSQIDNEKQSFLITLVDQRYYLRAKRASLTTTPVSWSSVLSTLATALGITLTPDTIATNYGSPSDRWLLYEKRASILIDAACNAFGHRVVANLDGTFKTVSYNTASAAATTLTDALVKTAGGLYVTSDLVRSVPESIKVVFPQISGGYYQDQPYTVSYNLADLSITAYGTATGVSGQEATVIGELVYDGTNGTACSNYAGEAATDWYNWQLINLDVTYPGITEWIPTGAEERIEWKYDIEKIVTRVLRGPFQELLKGIPESGPNSSNGEPNWSVAAWYSGALDRIVAVPEFIIPGTDHSGFKVTQYTVPTLTSDPTTSPVVQYVITNDSDGASTPQITQYVVLNGTSGGTGQTTIYSPTQYQSTYNFNSFNYPLVYKIGQSSGNPLWQYTVDNTSGGGGPNVVQYVIDPGVSITEQFTVAGATYPSQFVISQSGGATTFEIRIREGDSQDPNINYQKPASLQIQQNMNVGSASGSLNLTDDGSGNGTMTLGASGTGTLAITTGTVDATAASTIDLSGSGSLNVTGRTLTGFPSSGARTDGTIAAGGTSQGTATAITTDAVKVTGAVSGTNGVILPDNTGEICVVWNSDSGNTLKVYPPVGGNIGSGLTNVAVTHAAGTVIIYWRVIANKWVTTNAGMLN